MVDTAVTANSANIQVTHPAQVPAGGWETLKVEYCEWDGTTASSCQVTSEFVPAGNGAAAPQTTLSSLTGLKPSQQYRQRAQAMKATASITSEWGGYDTFTTTAYS